MSPMAVSVRVVKPLPLPCTEPESPRLLYPELLVMGYRDALRLKVRHDDIEECSEPYNQQGEVHVVLQHGEPSSHEE